MDHRFRLHHRLGWGLGLLAWTVLAATTTAMILMTLRIVAAALLLAMSASAATTALRTEFAVLPEIAPTATVTTTTRMALSTTTAAATLSVAIVQRPLDGPFRRAIRHTLRSTISPSGFTTVPIIPILAAFQRSLNRTIMASIAIIYTDVGTISNPFSTPVR